MTPLLLRAAVASASFLAAFGGALPDAPRAFEAVPGEAWVLSEVHSIDPSTQPLEEVEENYAFAFDGWLGTPPGVIQPSNVEVSDGALKLKIMNDESFDFKAVQNPSLSGSQCTNSCAPGKYTTGLVRSKTGFTFGYVEVKMKIPDAAVVSNIWLQ
eukprot:gene13228-31670_t